MKRTMYEAARHTPKRQATGSNPAGGAKNNRCKPFFRWFTAVFYRFFPAGLAYAAGEEQPTDSQLVQASDSIDETEAFASAGDRSVCRINSALNDSSWSLYLFGTRQEHLGSGLGLAIAAKAVQGMGGAIRARNGPNGGLAIEITLRKGEACDAEDPDHRG